MSFKGNNRRIYAACRNPGFRTNLHSFLGEFRELKTFFHGHSYTGNPLACAAALACLDIFEREETLKNLLPSIDILEKRLLDICDLPPCRGCEKQGVMAG